VIVIILSKIEDSLFFKASFSHEMIGFSAGARLFSFFFSNSKGEKRNFRLGSKSKVAEPSKHDIVILNN